MIPVYLRRKSNADRLAAVWDTGPGSKKFSSAGIGFHFEKQFNSIKFFTSPCSEIKGILKFYKKNSNNLAKYMIIK